MTGIGLSAMPEWCPGMRYNYGDPFCVETNTGDIDCYHGFGHCPYDLGPWGAWRAVLGEVSDATNTIHFCGHPIADDLLRTFLKVGTKLCLDAVGWSP